MPAVLTRQALNRALLARQGLLARQAWSPLEAVRRLGGLQAQDPSPPFIALWSRLEGFERAALIGLLNERTVVRGTLMRATLHLAEADDYRAWRGGLQPVLDRALNGVLKNLGVTLDLPAIRATAEPLFATEPRTFAEVRGVLAAAFPGVHERAMGFAVRMGLALVTPPEAVPWAFRRDPKFALARDWVGHPADPGDLDGMVLHYLAAFGPTSVADAQSWSGLTGLKGVFDRLGDRLQALTDERGRTLYDLPDSPRPPEDTSAPVRFLAQFDGVLLGHADRSRIIAEAHRARIVTRNLMVPATVLVDGLVAGTWKLNETKTLARLTVQTFSPLPARVREALSLEGERLAAFMAPAAARMEVRTEVAE